MSHPNDKRAARLLGQDPNVPTTPPQSDPTRKDPSQSGEVSDTSVAESSVNTVSDVPISIPRDTELREAIVALDKGTQKGVLTVEAGVNDLLALITASQKTLLDRIEQSVKQHTVPEGKHLVTRSYVLKTLEFERGKLEEL